jgi:hypothetical protein
MKRTPNKNVFILQEPEGDKVRLQTLFNATRPAYPCCHPPFYTQTATDKTSKHWA